MIDALIIFFILMTIVCIMSVGLFFGKKPISGSCGGVGAALGEENYTCEICGDDPNKCEEQGSVETQAYNAMDAQHKSFKNG